MKIITAFYAAALLATLGTILWEIKVVFGYH